MQKITVLLPYKFTLLSNVCIKVELRRKFYYPINLHYSQTVNDILPDLAKFYYPINLHYSQTDVMRDLSAACFTTL